MKMKEERFLIKRGGFVIDFKNVDFITYTQNEDSPEKWLMKFHIGDKETRYMSKSTQDTLEILENWASIRCGKGIFFEEQDLKYSNERF